VDLDAHAVDIELDRGEGKEFARSHRLDERTVIETAPVSSQSGCMQSPIVSFLMGRTSVQNRQLCTVLTSHKPKLWRETKLEER
jgi:hypothetical protein